MNNYRIRLDFVFLFATVGLVLSAMNNDFNWWFAIGLSLCYLYSKKGWYKAVPIFTLGYLVYTNQMVWMMGLLYSVGYFIDIWWQWSKTTTTTYR